MNEPTINRELAQKLMNVKSAKEAAVLLKENGHDIGEEKARRLFEKIQQEELSLDELEAVSGGSKRDYIKSGCAVTVEANSDCYFSNDACTWLTVSYDNMPTTNKCPDCGGILCYWDTVWEGISNKPRYNCAGCGGFFIDDSLHGTFIRIR